MKAFFTNVIKVIFEKHNSIRRMQMMQTEWTEARVKTVWMSLGFSIASVRFTQQRETQSERESVSLSSSLKQMNTFSSVKSPWRWWMAPEISSENLMDFRSEKCLDKLMHVIIFSNSSPLVAVSLQHHYM